MAAAAAAMADQFLESRVARLESDVAHIRSDIAEMKLDIRELRKEIGETGKSLSGEIEKLRADMGELKVKLTHGLGSNRIWMLLQSAGILGIMARAFGWL